MVYAECHDISYQVSRFHCDHLEDPTLAFKRLMEISMSMHEQQRQIIEKVNINLKNN